jgi:ribonuclease J
VRACVHRGTHEIGGSCVEVEHQGWTLVLDMGLPLEARPDGKVPAPAIRAFRARDRSRVAVLLSHGHPDHYGLIGTVPSDVAVFLGEATQRIVREAQFFSPIGADIDAVGHLRDRRPIEFGPFTVTPYLVDHSAFDSYGLLVEAGGRRLMYSGDIRATGRKAALFDRFLADPPGGVDVLLLEGTSIGRDPAAPTLSEQDVEERCLELFRDTDGMVLACYSGQNIDRMVTLHRAARRSGRRLVLDLYAAEVARATGRPETIPQGDWDSVGVYVPRSQRIRVKQTTQFDRVDRVRARRLYPEDLAGQASQLVMTFRSSMRSELGAGCLGGAHAIWSMWPGYLDQASSRPLLTWLGEKGIPLTILHASGHATPDDLRRYAAAVAPEQVVPVHTCHPERFAPLVENVQTRQDGEWWEI